MLDLLLVLTPISLIDSTSVVPFAVVVLAVLLSGARPYLSSILFLVGIVISYLASGMLITLGLGQFFDQMSEWMVHTWQNPETPGMLLQIVLGFLLIVIGGRLAARRKEKASQREVSEGMTPWQAFLLGVGSTLAGIWGALPYFAAIDQILQIDPTPWETFLALAYYNLVFVAPLGALIVIRAVAGERVKTVLDAVNRFFSAWGPRVIVGILVLLGIVLVMDGIGWFLGRPLLPT